MSARSSLEERAKAILPGRRPKCLEFVDLVLCLAGEVGEIQCRPVPKDRLQFLIPSQPPAFEVEIDAAKSKLRMMCARLAVLCQDSGGECILYGGEGVIRKEALDKGPVNGQLTAEAVGAVPGDAEVGTAPVATALVSVPWQVQQWKVRLKNTMHEQEFIIAAE